MANRPCKVCGRGLFSNPLLRYPNMPGVAQHLPDRESAARDSGLDLDIYQCSGCGLVQLDCEPVHYYREVIRAVGVSAEMRAFRQGQFRDFAAQHRLRGKRLVEIGCGRGEYLNLLLEAGVDGYGLEWGEEAVTACASSGLRVVRGFVEGQNYDIPGGPFDAFVMLSFFEHLPHPGEVLRGIAANLVNGGVGLVEVPNFDMILRDHMFAEFMRDHLFYFTARTLATTLEVHGFEVVEIREVWQQYILSAVVRKRQELDLAAFTTHQQRLQDQFDGFLKRYRNVAAWGAGHQAFAILALMGLSGKIRYVVDSAPFKQGKLTPVTHIPIVSPSTLQSDPVDALIVLAGSYSDEIVAIVREKFQIHIAVLRETGLEPVEVTQG